MYDFESGDLSLDFANTKDWHGSQKPVEKLNQYADLITWGEQAGLISRETAQRLAQQGLEDTEDTARAYELSIQLREAIYGIFSAIYGGDPIPEGDMELLNSVVRQAYAHIQVCRKDADCNWEWSHDVDGADLILFPIARAAAELLTSPNNGARIFTVSTIGG